VGFEARIEAIYGAHSDEVLHRLVHWTGGDWHGAEDMLQETMVRAWRNIDMLDPDPAEVRPWLLTVARRVTIDRFRSRAARPAEAEVAADDLERQLASVDQYDQALDRRVLCGLLDGLSLLHREVLVQVYLLDRTVPETAAALGVPLGTAKSRLHHALRALRTLSDDSAPSLAQREAELVSS